MDRGSATAATKVERQLRKNRNTTNTVSNAPSNRVSIAVS